MYQKKGCHVHVTLFPSMQIIENEMTGMFHLGTLHQHHPKKQTDSASKYSKTLSNTKAKETIKAISKQVIDCFI